MTLTPTTRASLLLRVRDPRDHEAWVEFDSLLESPPVADGPETDEFDRELRRAMFHLASEQVRSEVRPGSFTSSNDCCRKTPLGVSRPPVKSASYWSNACRTFSNRQPTSVPLPASLMSYAAGRRSMFNVTRKGVFAMLGTIGMTFLGMVLWQATEEPDISGQWTSDEWGTVVLEAK